MFSRPKSFSILYGIQRSFLTIFYLVSVISVFWVLFYLLHEVLEVGGSVIIPVSIGYLVIVVLVYSLIQVISYIPANLAGSFDPVKNGIAEGSISSPSDISKALADFMCSFFSFSFFDVEYAMVQVQGNEPVTSGNLEIKDTGFNADELERFTLSHDKTTYFRKIETDSGFLHLYLIPMIFGDRRIGYIAVGTRKKLWKMFVQLLNEFENDYVDDQVIHILDRQKK